MKWLPAWLAKARAIRKANRELQEDQMLQVLQEIAGSLESIADSLWHMQDDSFRSRIGAAGPIRKRDGNE